MKLCQILLWGSSTCLGLHIPVCEHYGHFWACSSRPFYVGHRAESHRAPCHTEACHSFCILSATWKQKSSEIVKCVQEIVGAVSQVIM